MNEAIDCPLSLPFAVKSWVFQALARKLDHDLNLTTRKLEKKTFSLRIVAFSMFQASVIETVYSDSVARIRYARNNDFYTNSKQTALSNEYILLFAGC